MSKAVYVTNTPSKGLHAVFSTKKQAYDGMMNSQFYMHKVLDKHPTIKESGKKATYRNFLSQLKKGVVTITAFEGVISIKCEMRVMNEYGTK